MRKVVCLFMVSLLLVTMNEQVLAYSYAHTFYEYYGVAGVSTARSPFRSDSAGLIDDWSKVVTGPNNQPRYLSGISDVHNGTDFGAKGGIRFTQCLRQESINIWSLQVL